MRAYSLLAPGLIDLVEVPEPPCGDDEVLLRTEAVSLCSTDVSYFRGHLRPESWPIVPGHEYVGRAVEVGRSVTGIAPGDRVVYWGQTDFGGMAEYRAIRPLLPNQPGETGWYTERGFYDAHQAAAAVVPDGLPSRLATLVEPLTSVLRCLLVNPPKPGDVCVVLGCGPSALLAVQVLRNLMGVGPIVVLDKDSGRIALARTLGADLSFDTSTQSDELDAFVREHHDHFADYVVDALPHVSTDTTRTDVRESAMGLLRPDGTYVVYGATALPQQISTWHLLAKGLRLLATPFDVRAFPMTRTTHITRTALGLIADSVVDVEPLITDTVAFTDVQGVRAAFTDYGANGGMKSSLLFTPVLPSLIAQSVGAPVAGTVASAPVGAAL
ncbi:alcohol dehydrogenase catalytic domain-containing protein [Actinosynnema pretiosum subsp. pretiosum]|uniref:Alcohol dehydrogenase catalytic domain-containing protein n=1 Tax=Actinosynnema pretiosum subsp. pretiosum TaxID=103721 RepID=A0AA45L6E5_9PSEU|nr:Starvation sensing protein RspB [Actinosynnema pretiosum subsp. pretiosum]QUF04166.1 alcohol dehydrogenase catalytic domain-containing protein [Actinosynnema pretiosum subsp. pretiosum]